MSQQAQRDHLTDSAITSDDSVSLAHTPGERPSEAVRQNKVEEDNRPQNINQKFNDGSKASGFASPPAISASTEETPSAAPPPEANKAPTAALNNLAFPLIKRRAVFNITCRSTQTAMAVTLLYSVQIVPTNAIPNSPPLFAFHDYAAVCSSSLYGDVPTRSDAAGIYIHGFHQDSRYRAVGFGELEPAFNT